MPLPYPEQARFYGLDEYQVDVLFIITWWYNGKCLKMGNEKRQLGTHSEPQLRELFSGWSAEEYSDHEDAHQQLLDRGFLREGWICRRKIDWIPTEQGLQAIRDIFKDCADDFNLRPGWASEDDSGPIFGDPNELLLHRKGVEAAAHYVENYTWVERLTWYPILGTHEHHPDLKMRTPQKTLDWFVEVLTSTGDRDGWVEKWESYKKRFVKVWWIFEGRSDMCAFFNKLHDERIYTLDGGPFSEPYKNWSADAVNRKIWRSRKVGNNDQEAAHLVSTITSLVEAESDDVTEWFDTHFEMRDTLNPVQQYHGVDEFGNEKWSGIRKY
ncbi:MULTISPECIES: hypothetical protein [Natrialbaceae]|uniref:hypothetical protein n=1 Tax=Natrialbaceae TaxID=1644061 RepID=UPI00207CFEBA|nr:hypothetical protein [Natronococcus sp. CG52]